MHNTCSTTSLPHSLTVASRTTEIWTFELREISTFREAWTLVIAFLERKVENRTQTSCRSGPILSLSTISFELYAKVAEETDVEVCNYGQFLEVQMLRDLDLDLGSAQGHVNIHRTCSTSCTLNHVTVAKRSTEIWPFEFRQILILDEVWTLVIAFLDGNSKIGLRQAVVHVPYYGDQPSVLSSTAKWRRR